MNLGFNTDIRFGETVYHVQTEDRGAEHPVIDTTVYAEGRVLHRRTSSYKDLLGPHGPSAPLLRQRVETQHRGVIEELRSGTLKLNLGGAQEVRGLKVELLNPDSWLATGAATLKFEVHERGTRRPLADVNLEVTLEGAESPARFAARTNTQGCAEISFLLPRLNPAGATLVIRAAAPTGQDEIRFQIRPRVPAGASPAPAK